MKNSAGKTMAVCPALVASMARSSRFRESCLSSTVRKTQRREKMKTEIKPNASSAAEKEIAGHVCSLQEESWQEK